MRIKVDALLVLGVFSTLNIFLVIVFAYLIFLTDKNYIRNLGANAKIAYVPFLDKNIKDIHVNSKAFVIYDPTTRVVIAGKNEHLRFAPASAAKVMTALLVLEEYDLKQALIAQGLEAVEGSTMKLQEQESITVENLLYGLMLPSANDAAHVLANNYPPAGEAGSGGTPAFVAAMNKKADALKLENTKFFDPSGYSNSNYTTAFDLARLGAYAARHAKLREIVSTKEKIVSDTTGKITHELSNLNELLGLAGVNGIKTGFTEEAQGVLISSLESDNKAYIIVVLNSPDRFGDTKDIIINAIRNINLISY